MTMTTMRQHRRPMQSTLLVAVFGVLVLLSIPKQTFARRRGGSYTGGAGDWYEGGLPSVEEMLTSPQMEWKMERSVGNHGTKNKGAKGEMDGTTTLKFTQIKDELRPSKQIVLFSTGERGYWRVVKPRDGVEKKKSRLPDSNGSAKSGVITPYEDAIGNDPKSRTLEIEVMGNRQDTDGPVLLYTIPIGYGRVQPTAVINDVRGLVRLLPGSVTQSVGRFHEYVENTDLMNSEGQKVGFASLTLPRGPGVVDSSWARGRQWFYKGRSRGNL
mmetsp:Transcript_46412/g.68557  ORF Transcript_46412/g.68557 Transcript_46412/m.68557 type:complete len:271 (+) Transcript_46412:77-889(+)|eukprot:CAMPEP_0195518656 /NCGR_PEP_ID=MMETSP0794_2-20130614/13442_1 /TAXON_ID=515487 /ORGANISM="Stephanopyxis turris, Strain CCMP 815" /LENGTH=270 /DNA_ID=CAMNT_0040647673 /DNA_START=72 /DNA_END=884 /DNA_ORIENTATION=-